MPSYRLQACKRCEHATHSVLHGVLQLLQHKSAMHTLPCTCASLQHALKDMFFCTTFF